MSTHRRAWKQRAGVVVALVSGALLTVPASPALAADVSVSPGSATVNAGSDTTITVRITPQDGDQSADISLTGLPSGVSCASGCGQVNFSPGNPQPKTQLLTIRANDNAQDANTSVTVQVRPDDSDPATGTFQLAVKGEAPEPQQPQTVKTVSGKVVNADGQAIEGALVMLRDSAGKERRTNTSGNGNFSFSGSESNPIAPGRIDLGASTDGASPVARSINANAGQSVTGVRLSIQLRASASPSASPSASESAPPSEEPLEEEATDTPSAEAPAAQQPAANEDSGGFGSWLLILLGGLFVAVGVGTIVLLYMRRKNEGDDGDGDGPDGPTGPGGPAAAGAIPAARGAYHGADDQTRVVNGMGAGPAATMVGGPSISDAPTMLQRPVVDDVPPDPYGAPPGPSYGVGGGQGGYGYGDDAPGQGGYGGAGGYGNAPSSGGGYGNGPSSGAGYGSPDYAAGAGAAAGAAGYAAQGGGYGNERFDEPTGRYTGDSTQYAPAADPYPTSTYQPEQDRGYDQAGSSSYGRGPEQGDGYGAGGGYGAASGGYDGDRQQGGYGDPTGAYGNAAGGGYGDNPSGGYGDAPAYGGRRAAGGGYGEDATGGYDNAPSGGYRDTPSGGYDSGRQQGGYGDAPTGGYDNPGGGGYDSRSQGGYDSGAGGYDSSATGGYDSGRQQGGYGDAPTGGYGNAGGGYDGGHQSGGYGQQAGGYGDGYGQAPQGGYGQGGYGQEPPQQRGGGYDNAYPNDPAQAGRARPDGQADRGGRRLDWLDD
ncbi:carboxypeptidase-like regulatory domain-containing protein [Micromonospora sp. CNB394]|uniref:carboxypeptidase-like regulatory domain-containing protein n=1 Tax=Micromonospora sp. CNB394 TaxID=1169151 RepID=UPI0004775CE2|nr:carboxypeptidase-like regulatory domain-containing protein [Micromonospora sp. CNB394]